MTQSKPVQNKSVQKNRTQKKIEGIYPLSPSQQGMLWDTLASQHSQPVLTAEETADQDNSGSKYIEISVYELNGALNVAHFQQAWQSVIARHSILRAGYVWEGQAEPLQFVLRQLTIALDYRDQRELSATAQAAALANYMAEERATGFDLTKPPLLRLALFQLAEERYHFVLTIHHILIDGWSLPLLLHDVVAWYEAHRAGTQAQLPTVPPYQSYIRWLKSQDVDAAAKFWQAYLQGIARPTPLGIVREDLTEDVTTETPVTQVVTERYQCVEQTLDTVTTARLQDIAKQERLVLNTFLRGIWAILLHRYSGQADVLFGATISGRPATLPDAGAIVGLFINTVPIRIQVTAEQPLLEWLQPLQRTAHDVEEQGYCSNGQIHSWSAVPGSLPLFESILVFQNYSVAGFEAQVADASIDVARVSSSGAHTPYALTIMVKQDMIKRAEREELDHGLQIELIYDTKRFQRAAIEQILAHWLLLLQAIAEDPHQSVETLLAQIPVAQIPQVAPLLQTHHAKRYATASTDREAQLVKLWEEVLGTAPVGIHDNFFDLGGHSLLLVKLRQRLQDELGQEIKIVDLFTYPTIAALSQHLFPMAQATAETEVFATETNTSGRTQGQSIQSSDDIAIVGMAGRFPGAASVTEFWQRIAQGEELITFFTPEELAAAGVPEALRNDPNYVPANGILAGFDRFDAAFFGIPPREAKELNPQHRLFLETVWTAIEDAGYDSTAVSRRDRPLCRRWYEHI